MSTEEPTNLSQQLPSPRKKGWRVVLIWDSVWEWFNLTRLGDHFKGEIFYMKKHAPFMLALLILLILAVPFAFFWGKEMGKNHEPNYSPPPRIFSSANSSTDVKAKNASNSFSPISFENHPLVPSTWNEADRKKGYEYVMQYGGSADMGACADDAWVNGDFDWSPRLFIAGQERAPDKMIDRSWPYCIGGLLLSDQKKEAEVQIQKMLKVLNESNPGDIVLSRGCLGLIADRLRAVKLKIRGSKINTPETVQSLDALISVVENNLIKIQD